MHVRHAMIAAGDVAVLADLSNYPEQAIAILKEVRTLSVLPITIFMLDSYVRALRLDGGEYRDNRGKQSSSLPSVLGLNLPSC